MMFTCRRPILSLPLLLLLFLGQTIHASTASPNTSQMNPVVVEANKDSAEYHQAIQLRKRMKTLVKEWYPRLREMLWTPGELPADAGIILEYRSHPDQENSHTAAHATKKRILIYDEYTRTGDDATGGLLIHEMVHLLQPYRNDRASWMVEAIADYFRYAVFDALSFESFLRITRESLQDPLSWAGSNTNDNMYYARQPIEQRPEDKISIEEKFRRIHCQSCSSVDYQGFHKAGYRYSDDPAHAAGMLVMIDHFYIPGFVYQLHRELFNSTKKPGGGRFINNDLDQLLKAQTNKGLNEMWCEYMAHVHQTDISNCVDEANSQSWFSVWPFW